MTKTFVKSSLALSVLMAMGAAQAAYLGPLKVVSTPTQNFSATVQVHDIDSSAEKLLAKLAPQSTYDKYHVTMPETAKTLTLALQSKSPLTLRVSGKMPAKDQAFPLLMELHEGSKVTVRQYNIRLGASGAVEPVAPQAAFKAPVVEAVPAEPAKPVVKAEEKAAPKVVAAKTEKVERPAAKPATTANMTPLQRMQAKNYDLDEPIVIEHGYTPWSLGMLYQKRYPGASVQQVLVALAVENPEAFPKGTVTQLKTGAKVHAPSADLVRSINKAAAQKIVQKGLKIDDVARTPMPIAKPAAKPAPKAAVKPAPVPKLEEKPAVAEPAVKAAEPVAEVAPKVAEPVAQEPEQKTDVAAQAPDQQAPAEQTPASPSATTSDVPEIKLETPAGVAAPEVTTQKTPTLEIMTEEEAVEEEESSSWMWWVLLALLVAAGGFVFVRTKQGKKVDFDSFKQAMAHKAPQSVKEEPKPMRQEAPRQEPRQAPRQEPQVAPTVAPVMGTVVKPVPAPMPKIDTPQETNVFDLVTEEEMSSMMPATPKAQPQVKPAEKVNAPLGVSLADTLEMARSFMAINSKTEAMMLLQEVVQNGLPEEQAQARELIAKIRQQA